MTNTFEHDMPKQAFPGRGAVLNDLARQLSERGYPTKFVKRFVPAWWSPDAESRPGALAQLKISLAQRLGLDVRQILDQGVVVPTPPEGVRFKGSKDGKPPTATMAYCGSIARFVAGAMSASLPIPDTALAIRDEILERGVPYVSLDELLEFCWSRNIAVVHVPLLPGAQKMQACTTRFDGRYVVVLTRRCTPAWAAFHIAHELCHIARGDIAEGAMVVDETAPAGRDISTEEAECDAFALEVLGGRDLPVISPASCGDPDGLAKSALRATRFHVDPEHVIWRCAKQYDAYPVAKVACSLLPEVHRRNAGEVVNRVAHERLRVDEADDETHDVLQEVLAAA